MRPKMDYMEQYIQLFGMNDLIPEKWFYSKKYKSVEEVYEACVKTGKTWRELTGWNEDRKKEIAL